VEHICSLKKILLLKHYTDIVYNVMMCMKKDNNGRRIYREIIQ